MTSPEEFGDIIVREAPDGGIVRVRDVARIELGAQDYTLSGRINGKPGAIIAVYQLPGSNAVDAAKGVRKLMEEAKKRFPQDVDYVVSLDTTDSVHGGHARHRADDPDRDRAGDAGGLSLPARLARDADSAARGAGFADRNIHPVSRCSASRSIRFRLFGLVLAIGLVVDDAIVVVEAVERHMEEGMAPKAAALKAMEEISGPVIGIALVLSAVFVPTVFIPGITGRLYQQFAVTIAISVILSAFNALTLSPALVGAAAEAEDGKPWPAAALLQLVQPHVRPRDQRLPAGLGRADPQERLRDGGAGGRPAWAPRSSAAACPPASCRAKIRAICSCTLQLPNASSLERTEAASRESGDRFCCTRRA